MSINSLIEKNEYPYIFEHGKETIDMILNKYKPRTINSEYSHLLIIYNKTKEIFEINSIDKRRKVKKMCEIFPNTVETLDIYSGVPILIKHRNNNFAYFQYSVENSSNSVVIIELNLENPQIMELEHGI